MVGHPTRKGGETKMAKEQHEEAASGEVVVQLATRIPKRLHRELKLYAVTSGQSVSDLVSGYIREGLKATKPQRGRPRKGEDDAAA